MVAESRIAPEMMFDPENTVQQGVILLRGPKLSPNAAQTAGGAKLGLGNVRVIVPELLSIPDRLVDCKRKDKQ